MKSVNTHRDITRCATINDHYLRLIRKRKQPEAK